MKDFAEFEARADKYVSELDLSGYPVRSVFTYYFGLMAFSSLGMIKEISPISDLVVGRLSYIHDLIRKCDFERIGASAYDAVSAFAADEKFGQSLLELVEYGAFCEAAPFVWRKIYKGEITDAGVELSYESDEVARSEALDILLTQLTLPFSISTPDLSASLLEHYMDQDFYPIIRDTRTLIDYRNWFYEHFYECSIVPEAVFEYLGVSFEEFKLFRASCLAFAQFHISVLRFLFEKCKDNEVSPKYSEAIHDWYAPYLDRKIVDDALVELSGLSLDKYRVLMGVYSCDLSSPSGLSEGFTPPFLVLGEAYLFSPYMVMNMMSSRNILYSLLKNNQKDFDETLSPSLEPHLIDVACKVLGGVDGLKIIQNFVWEEGEFDILIYSETLNKALHVQAKATMPAEGGRMVARLEGRMEEAIKQLRRFDKQPSDVKDNVISRAIGSKVTGVDVQMAVLGWAGFGTQKVWKSLSDIAPVNVYLLAMMVKKLKDGDDILKDFVGCVQETLKEFEVGMETRQEVATIKLGFSEVRIPSLRFDNYKLLKFKSPLFEILDPV